MTKEQKREQQERKEKGDSEDIINEKGRPSQESRDIQRQYLKLTFKGGFEDPVLY